MAEIRKILDEHGQLTTFYNGKLLVYDGYEFIDVTNWTKKQVYDWLGYGRIL